MASNQPSPGVTALNTAYETLANLAVLFLDPLDKDVRLILRGVQRSIEHGRDELVACNASALAAHQRTAELHALADELYHRECIALDNHAERLKLIETIRRRDDPPSESRTIVVPTDSPRPTITL